MEKLQNVYLLVENVPYVTFERVHSVYLTKQKASETFEYFKRHFPDHDYKLIHRLAE